MMKWKWLAVALASVIMFWMVSLGGAQASTSRPRSPDSLIDNAVANTYTVTSTADSGDNTNAAVGTLRRAMVDANNHPGLDLIKFDISGSGVKTIVVKNYFPDISDDAGVIIDARDDNHSIQIDGSNVHGHHGLHITSNNNTIAGLVLNGFHDGAAIDIEGGSNNTIIGNYIGTNPAGNRGDSNAAGVMLTKSNNNTIGGTNNVSPGGSCTGDCNLISGNTLHGVVIDHSAGNTVIGNFIGVNLAGNSALPNSENGVLLGDSPNNTIGGVNAQERNVISGNNVVDIEIGLGNSHDNTIQGNYVGSNSAGDTAIAMPGTGILVDNSAHDNLIDRNLIVGHRQFGILVFLSAVRTTITNNRIGISANGDQDLGNHMKGIEVQTNSNTIVSNRIANNGSDGVRVKAGMNNRISQNAIFNNGQFGINLGTDAFTPNDPGDGDGGANGLQNFPDISSALFDGTTLTVSGNLNSHPNARYTLEFFYNPSCDLVFDNAVGEGQTYLGNAAVTTNGSGNAGFSVPLGGFPGNGVITATATDSANNTSEFSYCKSIVSGQTKPGKPQSLSPSNGESASSNPPILSWQPVSGATYYRLMIRQDSSKGTVVYQNNDTTSTRVATPKLTSKQTYFWLVKACNAAGCTKSGWTSFSVP